MVDFEFFDSFYNDSVTKEVTVTAAGINIDSSQISVESLSLEEKLNTQNDLTFGQCNPHGVEMDIFSECPNLIGVTVTIDIILSDHPEEPFTLGRFKVYEDALDEDTDLRHIVAWDALSEINNADITQWWNGLALPMTVRNLRDSFFQQFGITQEEKTLINDSAIVNRTTYGELTGIEVLTDILNMNAVSGYIGRNGYFKFIDFADPDEVDIDESQYQNIEIETFMTDAINKVQIRSSGTDIGAIVGTGTNAYIIEDNMLLYGKTAAELETIATNIYNKVSAIQYYPCEIEMVGNPCIECGDMLHISVNGVEKDTFVLNRNLDGIQEMIDDVQTPGQKTRSEQVYSINKELRKMRGKSFYIEKTVEGLKLEVEDISEDYVDRSTFEQSAENVQLQIESLQSQIDGEIQYYEGNDTPTLLNYPAWDFCTNIPCNNTVQTTDDLHFIYTTQDYQSHLQDLYFDDDDAISYRFSKNGDEYLWREIADSQTTVIMQRLTEVEATASGLSSTVTEVQAQIDGVEVTTTELQSQITQQASAINAKVSQTGGQAQSFAWELLSSGFKLKANNNVVFNCDSSGVELTGKFHMTGGSLNINADSDSQNIISLQHGTMKATFAPGYLYVGNPASAVSINSLGISTPNLTVGGYQYHHENAYVLSDFALLTSLYGFDYLGVNAFKYSAEAGGYVFGSIPSIKHAYAFSNNVTTRQAHFLGSNI